MSEEIEPRVRKLESSQGLLQQELHQMNSTLAKIETAIEKQNEITIDIRLLRQEFKNNSTLVWLALTGVGAVMLWFYTTQYMPMYSHFNDLIIQISEGSK